MVIDSEAIVKNVMVKACGYNWRDVISIVSQDEVQKSCWWANKAIIRERHPIPTTDEIIKDVRELNIFSKSDLKWSYHQILLGIHVAWKRSVTYKGMLFERKWCLASPLLQRNISKSFKKCCCSGMANISDNVIIYGPHRAEYESDWRKCSQDWRTGALLLSRRNI